MMLWMRNHVAPCHNHGLQGQNRSSVEAERRVQSWRPLGSGSETMGGVALRIIKIGSKSVTAARWQPLCAPLSDGALSCPLSAHHHISISSNHDANMPTAAADKGGRNRDHPSVGSISALKRKNATEERYANDCSEEYCRCRRSATTALIQSGTDNLT
jgi:hypothetical protein